MNIKKRNVGLDGLRVIGLFAIILAHINPPVWLFQLRNFDVPLMVFVSGAVYGLSSGSSKSYFSYFKSRVGRLLIPTWTFLSIFFIFAFVVSNLTNQRFPFSINVIISSFDLTDGIGYVWIIRVFILVAISLPLLAKANIKLKNFYLPFLLTIFIIYELFFNLYSGLSILKNEPIINFFIGNIVFYIVPYGIVAGIGLYADKLNSKKIFALIAIFIAAFATIAINLASPNFIPTQNFKYPPQAYYFSYALAVSLLLYVLSKTGTFQKIFGNRLLIFISTSSLWIYLWQILFIFVWESIYKYLNSYLQNFIFEFIFLVFFSTLTAYIQKRLVNKIMPKISSHNNISSLLTIAFLR